MISVRITNLSQFRAQCATWVANTKRQLEGVVFTMMYDAQAWATNISPVYSGDFASNWNVSFGSPDTTFVSTKDYYGMDYPDPVSAPWGKGNFNLSGFTLGQRAFLTNAAEHDEPYAWKIENGTISFRPVNVGRDAVRAKTLNHLKHTYARITKPMMGRFKT